MGTRTAMEAVVAWACLAATVGAAPPQALAPIGDRVDEALLPAGVWEQDVIANAQLAYLFKIEDGKDVAHLIADVVIETGGEERQRMSCREAVIWMTRREHSGRPYHHLQILLWQNAEIEELGGTITSGPALFVTLNTFGEIRVNTDDVGFQSSANTQVYQEGDRIRRAIEAGELPAGEMDLSTRVVDAVGLGREEERAPKPVVNFRAGGEVALRTTAAGGRVLTATGGVYLSRSVPGREAFFEIQADSVVLFLPAGSAVAAPLGAGDAGEAAVPPGGAGRLDRRGSSDRQVLASPLGELEVESAYLEGDIVMTQGANMIRASRLYYDFFRERAVVLDAVVRTMLEERKIPLYVRAEEIRQFSQREFVARNAIVTTSEFFTPHYHIGAERVELINRTPPDPTGRVRGIRSGSFAISHATLNVADVPVLYWPYVRGHVATSETAIKNVRTGFSDDFGLELETEWHLFNLLGFETPDGFEATLSLDYFSERGPAAGIDVDYKRDRYFGLIRGYAIDDDGEDVLGRTRVMTPDSESRGRILLRHRQYLEQDWELTLEFSYISDDSFLEEFFESEFDNEKEQETLLRLKKQRDNWAFTATLQPRILDFATQTERLPEFGLHLIGEPIYLPGGGTADFFSENRAGMVRYRPAEQNFFDMLRDGGRRASGSVFRADSRQELEVPVDIGPWRFVPFASVRGTAWDDTPVSSGMTRGFGTFGVRGSAYLSRVYPEVRSEMFDLDGIRHVIKSDVVAWVASTNRDPDELFPFDETVEGLAEVDGVTVGVRQRLQTKRGAGDNRRTVDVVTLDVEAGAFNDAEGRARTNGFTSFSRPENSIARNFVNSSLIWRLNDRTAVVSEMNYDVNDGEVDILNVSMAVERPPRFSYILGYRFIEESDSNLLGFDLNYQMTEKHTLAVREAFDLEQGRTLDFTIALIRKFPRWFGALSFALDEAEDDFGVSVSLWPEGLPQAALGSRRFTGLATTTRLAPP